MNNEYPTGQGAAHLDQTLLAEIATTASTAPFLMIAVSGAHLYGFASSDSDIDLRGTHLLPLTKVLGLDAPILTLDHTWHTKGLEIDLVSHDLAKFLTLLLRQNGNYLEQLFSPLVIVQTPRIDELRHLVRNGTIARHAYHAYAGYARDQWRMWRKEAVMGAGHIKPLLYAYRVSLTGLHLLQTGEVIANLPWLASAYAMPELTSLIDLKVAEKTSVPLDVDVHDKALQLLQDALQLAYEKSSLPQEPTNRAALNDFLVQVRLTGGVDV
ncbi:MAG: nucleotidyltransferase domain-containing protein [Caldilineaceae bacterium]